MWSCSSCDLESMTGDCIWCQWWSRAFWGSLFDKTTWNPFWNSPGSWAGGKIFGHTWKCSWRTAWESSKATDWKCMCEARSQWLNRQVIQGTVVIYLRNTDCHLQIALAIRVSFRVFRISMVWYLCHHLCKWSFAEVFIFIGFQADRMQFDLHMNLKMLCVSSNLTKVTLQWRIGSESRAPLPVLPEYFESRWLI